MKILEITENKILSAEDAHALWIEHYGKEMAERVFYNIKDELLHAVSDLKSIRVSACDTQDRLEAMSRVEFARWLLTYFTDALEKYDWPEAHSEGLAKVINDKVRQPLLNQQCLLEKIIGEAHPNQQLSRYNPSGDTYRQEKMPNLEPDVIDTAEPIHKISRLDRTDTDSIDRLEHEIDVYRLKKQIKSAMTQLTPRKRQILYLRYFQDMSYEEIAEYLGLSITRVKSIIEKSLHQLRYPPISDKLTPFIDKK